MRYLALLLCGVALAQTPVVRSTSNGITVNDQLCTLSGVCTIPIGSTPGYALSGVISGGGWVWTGGLNYRVSAAVYNIAGTNYTSQEVDLALQAADPTFDRIDIIALDNNSTAVVIQGTPAASPARPALDQASQLELTIVIIPAGGTTPSNAATTLLYDENVGASTEWNTTSSGGGWSLASTNNPYHGTKDIEATSLTTGNFVQLQKGSGTVDLSSQNTLSFYLRSKATWANNRSMTIYFANAGVQIGAAIVFREGSFGFVSSNTTTYQQIVLPTSLFQTAAQPVNQLVFKIAGSGGTPGFYLDWVQLQSGTIQVVTPSAMNPKGTWSSAPAYNTNDAVTYNNGMYVALTPNTNVTPVDGTTWKVYSPAQQHSISFTIDGGGSAIATGALSIFPPVFFVCTINRVDVTADQSGSITVDVWKVNAAIPTSSNKISASAPITLSSAQINLNGSLSGWTTAVSSGDVFGFSVASASTVTRVLGVLWCQ